MTSPAPAARSSRSDTQKPSTWWNTMPTKSTMAYTVGAATTLGALVYNYHEDPTSFFSDAGTALQWGASKGSDVLSSVGSALKSCVPSAREALIAENSFALGVGATLAAGGFVAYTTGALDENTRAFNAGGSSSSGRQW